MHAASLDFALLLEESAQRVRYNGCGEYVHDLREVCREGKVLCRPCADQGYYARVRYPVCPIGKQDVR